MRFYGVFKLPGVLASKGLLNGSLMKEEIKFIECECEVIKSNFFQTAVSFVADITIIVPASCKYSMHQVCNRAKYHSLVCHGGQESPWVNNHTSWTIQNKNLLTT